MKKVIINVLASDFVNNSFTNAEPGLDGCPLERAFTRAIPDKKCHYVLLVPFDNIVEDKVIDMFYERQPIEDFSFDISYNPERKCQKVILH